ncbi:DUF2378 family protein [Archangium lansingense]|uniref:DUF2378 family protein n=1 Tax=Archangium lansingense TaxID=2995310 RepID=UPI003B7C9D51
MEADTREAVAERIQQATPEEKISGMFCESAFLAMRELLGREQADEVRAATWPTRPWVSFVHYPVVDLLRMVSASAELLEKRGLMSYAQGLEELGGWVTRIIQSTPVSRAYRLAAGNDPHERMALALGSARILVTYGERKYEREGPTDARLLFKRELMGPSWMLGSYIVVAQAIPDVQISVTLGPCREPGMNFQLHCSW